MRYLITGGTGSLGTALARRLKGDIRIYSRDEFKQSEMQKVFPNLTYFLGDVRDRGRLKRAMDGVDIVIHCAALKQVPALEYNPTEAVKTNVLGAMNVIEASLDAGVKQVVALSTDKAVNPVNLYGATKLASDKLFVAANDYGGRKTRFNVVRYGNVAFSRGSVIPFFEKSKEPLPVTDHRMTRFWITIDQGVDLIERAMKNEAAGVIYVAKIPSFYVTDLAKALGKTWEEVGIRDGEKLDEVMITAEDSPYTLDCGWYYAICPQKIGNVPDRFTYSSDMNRFLTKEEIYERISSR